MHGTRIINRDYALVLCDFLKLLPRVDTNRCSVIPIDSDLLKQHSGQWSFPLPFFLEFSSREKNARKLPKTILLPGSLGLC